MLHFKLALSQIYVVVALLVAPSLSPYHLSTWTLLLFLNLAQFPPCCVCGAVCDLDASLDLFSMYLGSEPHQFSDGLVDFVVWKQQIRQSVYPRFDPFQTPSPSLFWVYQWSLVSWYGLMKLILTV